MNLSLDSVFYRHENCEKYLLEDINLSLNLGELTVLQGNSGIGKTTLSKIICGAIPKIIPGVLEGTVSIDHKNIQDLNIIDISQRVGIVFQDPDTQLFMPTVEDEIAFGLENMCIERREMIDRVGQIICNLKLEQIRLKNPKECSGGEKQLIVFSSVLVMDRPILILDEAFSQVDGHRKKLLEKIILKLKTQGKSILMIDHENTFSHLADQVFYLQNGRLLKKDG